MFRMEFPKKNFRNTNFSLPVMGFFTPTSFFALKLNILPFLTFPRNIVNYGLFSYFFVKVTIGRP